MTGPHLERAAREGGVVVSRQVEIDIGAAGCSLESGAAVPPPATEGGSPPRDGWPGRHRLTQRPGHTRLRSAGVSERPAIVSIEESPDDDHTRVVVELAWNDAVFRGEAVGLSEGRLRPRLVGEATLRAVEAVTNNRIHLRLGAIATIELGPTQVAMAQVELDGDTGPFVGSALLRDRDASGATVRAVLDAINRRLQRML